MSVCLSVCPFAWNDSSPSGRTFIKTDILGFFESLSRKCKFHSNLTRITGTSHEDRCTFLIIPRPVPLRMRNVSDKRHRGNQNTPLTFNNFLFLENRAVYDNVEKYCRVVQVTDDNMAQAHCMLDNEGYKYTPRTCYIYCFSNATMVARTRLSVTLLAAIVILSQRRMEREIVSGGRKGTLIF